MYHLFIATPDKVVFDSDVKMLIAPGASGYFEVLTDHAAIISSLKPGKLEVVDKDDKKWVWAISGGYLDMLHNNATLLPNTAELASEIDLPRAEEALERAQKLIESKDPSVDIPRAKIALAKAENRIKVAKGSHS